LHDKLGRLWRDDVEVGHGTNPFFSMNA
jgi:hypothetical protein